MMSDDDTTEMAAPKRKWFGLAAIAGAVAAAGALGYTLLSEPAEKPVPLRATAPSVPAAAVDPLAGVAPDERLKLAQDAAFPEGRFHTTDDGVRIDYVAGVLVDAPFGPVLVSEGRVPDAGHVDSGHVAIHYLAPSGRGYRLVKAFPDAIQSGSFGQMAEMAVSNEFSALPVVHTQGGGTWQGYSCGWTQLTELTPNGPVELANFQDSYSNGGAAVDDKDVRSTEGKIADVVPGRSFTVRFTGDRAFTAQYVRAGDEYQLQGGEKNALGGC